MSLITMPSSGKEPAAQLLRETLIWASLRCGCTNPVVEPRLTHLMNWMLKSFWVENISSAEAFTNHVFHRARAALSTCRRRLGTNLIAQ